MKQMCFTFIKKEIVLVIASVLAVTSCCLIPPDMQYSNYIDSTTLILLFCLMAVTAGLQEIGFFQYLGGKLLKSSENEKKLVAVLVFLCFFSSMFITNDVALITFVPLSMMVLKMARREKLIPGTVILQTIAANLGSMLTPIGNPQNLYLYSVSRYSVGEFIRLMLPYTLISGILLFFCVYRSKKISKASLSLSMEVTPLNKKRLLYYFLLFFFCILAVVHVLHPLVLLAIILTAIFVENKKLLIKVDYGLLLTFIALFIFIGNVGRMPLFRDLINTFLYGNEAIVAVTASQVISNVPTALAFSEFTSQWKDLIVGTNLGGLGTLIASMASLISYKQICCAYPDLKTKYLAEFTLWNLVFLAVLMAAAFLLF